MLFMRKSGEAETTKEESKETATDYHPEAEKFLDINTELNKDDEIPFVRTCWSNEYQED